MPRPIRVAIAAYDGVSLLDLSGPLEALRLASTHPNHLGTKLVYDCHVVSSRGRTVLTADGLKLGTQPVSTLDRTSIDTLIGPGACNLDDVFRDRELIKWLRRRAPRCRRVCSVCIGTSQYSALLASQVESASETFADLERWISENLRADLRVERLAERAGMSPRNVARRYMLERKRTPARAVEGIRVDAARRALEETPDRIDEIARRCGFSSEEQLRGAFARQVGMLNGSAS